MIERFLRERPSSSACGCWSSLPEAWERTGRHPEYVDHTVFDSMHITLHDLLHGYRIEGFLRRQSKPEQEARRTSSRQRRSPRSSLSREAVPGALAPG